MVKCEHKRIKSTNCVISCIDCGEILPIDYLVGKEKIEKQNAEGTAEPVKRKRRKSAKTAEEGEE
jgi:hypothetical protein